MYVDHLSLADFRSYDTAELALAPGVSVFVGSNGHGKTNLVEALAYLSSLSSHRVATDAPLVRAGAARAVVRCGIVGDGRRMLAELEITPGAANRARLNGGALPRARDLIGALRTVTFAPEDLALVKGDPAERRRFLDELLVLRTPRLAGVRADWDRVLKQRNTLLKSMRRDRRTSRSNDYGDSTLDVWDSQLAVIAAELVMARLELVDLLRPRIAQAYAALAPGRGEAAIAYRSSIPDTVDDDPQLTISRDHLHGLVLQALAHSRAAEVERGSTLVGPHRDELVLQLGDLPAKGYASHGESWSFALALRLASYGLLRDDDRAGGDPVLILDDVFAELDVDRRERLAAAIADAEQVLITAAVAEDIPPGLDGARFNVTPGAVVAA